jgi:hypothetical protein
LASITNISVEQTPGLVDPGDLNVPILKINIITDGNLVIDSFSFSTTGTTVDAYIDSAKLYYTGVFDSFNTTNLVNYFTSPTGNYNIDSSLYTLIAGYNYFWLTYDVSSSIVHNNYLDGELNSVSYNLGTTYVPDTTNYSGYIDLNTQWYPMTFISAEAHQVTDISLQIDTGSYITVPVLQIKVTTTGGINSLTCSSVTLSTSGTTDVLDITSATINSTGTSSVYSLGDVFPSVLGPSGSFVVDGLGGIINLFEGENYLWLIYNCSNISSMTNVLDATADYINISGDTYSISPNSGVGETPYNFISYTASTCEQLTGYTKPGSIVPIFKIKVSTTGTLFFTSGLDIYPWISNLYLGITGSTDAINDISDVMIYGTGDDESFSSVSVFGSLGSAPSGNYTIGLTSGGTPPYGLVPGDNYFWVAYSISPSATLGNVVDATFDSLDFDGKNSGNYVPTVSDPSGNIEIVDEMVVNAVDIFTDSNGNSYPGEKDISLFKIEVGVSGYGYPQKFWNFSFTNDSYDQVLNDKDLVTNFRLYFTGTSSTYNDSILVGTASYPNLVVYNTNDINLVGELGSTVTNYFWLVADVATNAYYKQGVTSGHVYFTADYIQFIETSITI